MDNKESQKNMMQDTYENRKAIESISTQDYEKVLDSRDNIEPVITKEKVVAGIKFIVENQDLKQEDLINGLIDLGCNFTTTDIANEFHESIKVADGIKEGNIACGALVIINMRDSEYGRMYCTDKFLTIDNDTSLYHYIRLLTNDNNYTKENIEENKTHRTI